MPLAEALFRKELLASTGQGTHVVVVYAADEDSLPHQLDHLELR
jgi:hypothetical protein